MLRVLLGWLLLDLLSLGGLALLIRWDQTHYLQCNQSWRRIR